MSLKLVFIAVIVQCLFSIWSSFMGRFIYGELSTTSRLLSRNVFRTNIITYNMLFSFIMLVVVGIYLFYVK
jgi:hypothetical protein